MSILGNRSFVAVAFSDRTLRGAYFERRNNRFSVVRHAELEITGNRDEAWKKLVKTLDFSSAVPMYVGGAVSGVTFFRTSSVAMDSSSRRSALEMELNRHMLEEIPDHVLQFVPLEADESGNIPVNVCVIPETMFSNLASAFSACSRRADNFIYPLLALHKDDPALYIEELESDFMFSDGQWRVKDTHYTAGAWQDIFNTLFSIPQDMDVNAFAGVLLIARLVSRDDFSSLRDGIRVLPDQLRPVRFRKQFICSAVLALLLAGNIIWGFYLKNHKASSGYRETVQKTLAADRETKSIRAQLRREQRAHKERQRLISGKAGAHDVLTDLAEFSALLPGSAMVTSYRRGESDIDMVIMSEDENLNFPALLKPISGKWRIGQIQQRQRGNTTSAMVNIKLVPAESVTNKKARKK